MPVTWTRPSFLRTTFHLSAPSAETASVVPKMPGWSVPSTTIVSVLPEPKSNLYLFSPAAATFISSVSLLLDGFSFHLPTKGSGAAHTTPFTRQTNSSKRNTRFITQTSAGAFSRPDLRLAQGEGARHQVSNRTRLAA